MKDRVSLPYTMAVILEVSNTWGSYINKVIVEVCLGIIHGTLPTMKDRASISYTVSVILDVCNTCPAWDAYVCRVKVEIYLVIDHISLFNDRLML
jgi:hypothetical protein